jgi:hypothetical protein
MKLRYQLPIDYGETLTEASLMAKLISSVAEEARQSLLTFRLATVAIFVAIGLALLTAQRYGFFDFPN